MNLKKIVLFFIILIILNNCTTFRANLLLYKVTTKEDKALLLYNEALRMYNDEFKAKENLEIIPKINQYLLDAYKLNPLMKESHDLIVELENYRMNELKSNLDSIRDLSSIPERTDLENYKLVLAIKNANKIGIDSKFLKDSTKKYKNLIPKVVIKQENELLIRQETITSSNSIDLILETSSRYKILFNEIISLDSHNEIAHKSNELVSIYLTDYINNQLEKIQNLTKEGSYIDSELLVRKTENINNIFELINNELFNTVKFDLFYNWSTSLYSQKRYEIAKNIGELAYDIEKNTNMVQLLKKINSAIESRSFESTINDVLASIDFYLDKEDPKEALNIINVNYNKFKNPNNKSKLNSKKSSISETVNSIYSKGVDYYREENFSKALERFKVVYDYDIQYKDVKNYYDLSYRKVKALSGI